jgi:class 3 adenylate cyclase/ligand-binding sensor domain-containing protein
MDFGQIQTPALRRFGLFLLGTLAAACLFSQNEPVRLHSFGFEDGLSHRNVFKVQQDTQGFLWIATEKGLNRFDGNRFVNRGNSPDQSPLPDGNIHDMHLDASNRLWLASGETLLAFKPSEGACDTVFPNKKRPAPAGRLGQLTGDATGHLWATGFTSKDTSLSLLRFNGRGELNFHYRLPGGYEKRPIAALGKQVFVGAFENELWVFNENGQQVKQYEFPAPLKDRSYSRLIALQASPDGTLWALLDHGQLYYLTPGSSAFSRHPMSDFAVDHIHSSAFWVNQQGDIWLGGTVSAGAHSEASPCSSVQPGAALLHFDAASNQVEDYSYYYKQALPHTEPPRQLFEDQTGVVWISSFFGLVHLTENKLFTRYLSDGNDCCRNGVCSMRGMAEDDEGNIYFTYYNSIHVLSPRSGSLSPLLSPAFRDMGPPFGLLYFDHALWTGDGLRIDLRRFSIDTLFKTTPNTEGVVMLDQDSTIWFGHGGQLFLLHPASYSASGLVDKSSLLARDSIGHITFLQPGLEKNTVWMGTRERGFYKINKTDGSARRYHTGNLPGLPSNRILALKEHRGKLWIASASGLACLELSNDSLSVFTSLNGLPNNFVNGILLEGDSALWASTDNGLCRLNLRSGKFASYFQNDGLPSNEFNRISFLKARDGRMYFGGLNGVAAFNPSARYGKKDSQAGGKIMLTGFAKYNGKVDLLQIFGLAEDKPIDLTYRDEMFSFWFSLSDYSDPKLHRFSYKLDGWDADWSVASPINFVRYFNIPAGKYTFRVRASMGSGQWVEDELALPVVIRQAFYKTRLFQMLALGFLSVLIYGIMRYRLYLHKKHEQELEVLVQERTKELETEKHKSEELLLNILPAETAEELKQFGSAKARRFENVTVMFSDFVGFTAIAGKMEPEELVAEIDYCFRAFDEIIELYGLEKIKTIGDAYLCAGGISHTGEADSAMRVVQAALEIQSFLNAIAVERADQGKPHFEARIGIHTGPVVAGIVGIKKFAYDIWGDTVNIAQRMQTNGEEGRVNISKSTFELVKGQFNCSYRGKIAAKNKGDVDMYFVERATD